MVPNFFLPQNLTYFYFESPTCLENWIKIQQNSHSYVFFIEYFNSININSSITNYKIWVGLGNHWSREVNLLTIAERVIPSAAKTPFGESYAKQLNNIPLSNKSKTTWIKKTKNVNCWGQNVVYIICICVEKCRWWLLGSEQTGHPVVPLSGATKSRLQDNEATL